MMAAGGMSISEGYGGAAAALSNASAASAAGPMQAKSGKKKKESNGSGGNWFSRLFDGLFNKKQEGMNVVTDSDEDEKSYFDDIYVTDNPKYEDEEDML